MTRPAYFSAPGLSQSGMRDLAISPLRFWYLNINPDRPVIEPTPEMVLGSALHCAVLEPTELDKRYACELNPPEDALDTIDDMRQFLRDKGVTPKGTRKAEIIAQVQAADPDYPILEVLLERHLIAHAGKEILSIEFCNRVSGCCEALVNEPKVQELLKDGQAEVPIFATDPDTGVLLKAKLDWVHPKFTVDIKTFTQKRNKSIDKSVTEAIWYEGYYRQAYFYGMMRALDAGVQGREGPQMAPDFIMPFVQSEPPHEVRIRILRAKTAGQPNLYWERARVEVREFIRTYAACREQFGDKPWRTAQTADPLEDAELPGLAY
jgi:PDDEXK-like domain of unknown function (DUF3799)